VRQEQRKIWEGGEEIRFNIKADGTYSYHWSLKTKPEIANTKKTIPKTKRLSPQVQEQNPMTTKLQNTKINTHNYHLPKFTIKHYT
jgi:hypothetical protein